MTAPSFNRLFRGGALQRDALTLPDLRAHRAIRVDAGVDSDELRGRFGRAKAAGGGAKPRLSQGLDKRLGPARRFGFRGAAAATGGVFDTRQRAVVKLHFFGHGGGGGAALKAHARYVARDTAVDEKPTREPEHGARGPQQSEQELRSHADYLARERPAATPFYDGLREGVDGAARMAVWAREDRRHFRIILAAEKGAEIGDLRGYTRAVMERAEAALGTRLEWVAVNHRDTDNPHTHIVLRGRRGDGRALVLPRDFVKHGFRAAARDEASARLGPRTREDERLVLARETRAQRPTRLDAMIDRQLDQERRLRISRLEAPDGDSALTNALKSRARELQRLGLAEEISRNVLRFNVGWRGELTKLEMHLDIRKEMFRQQTRDLHQENHKPRGTPPGLDR